MASPCVKGFISQGTPIGDAGSELFDLLRIPPYSGVEPDGVVAEDVGVVAEDVGVVAEDVGVVAEGVVLEGVGVPQPEINRLSVNNIIVANNNLRIFHSFLMKMIVTLFTSSIFTSLYVIFLRFAN